MQSQSSGSSNGPTAPQFKQQPGFCSTIDCSYCDLQLPAALANNEAQDLKPAVLRWLVRCAIESKNKMTYGIP